MEKVKTKISTEREIKEFEVRAGQYLVISDPCYDIEELKNCESSRLNHKRKAKAGIWTYKYDPETRALSVYEKNSLSLALEAEEFDEVLDFCVDSGQVGVFLEHSYRDDSLLEDIEFEDEAFDSFDEDWYRACCEVTISEKGMGFVPYGFVTGTKWGDGIYPAGLIRSKDTNEVIYIQIETHHLFNDEEDEEYMDI